MNEKEMKKLKVTAFILVSLFLLMLAFSFYEHYQDLNNQLSSYKIVLKSKDDKLIKYKNDIEDLKRKLALYEAQISFMDNYIVICPNDGTNLYHKYNCSNFDKRDSFYAFNITSAQSQGFYPCPLCETEISSTKDNNTEIVYITNSGTKYHRAGCSYLKSKNAITKEKAINQGYTACSRCNP